MAADDDAGCILGAAVLVGLYYLIRYVIIPGVIWLFKNLVVPSFFIAVGLGALTGLLGAIFILGKSVSMHIGERHLPQQAKSSEPVSEEKDSL